LQLYTCNYFAKNWHSRSDRFGGKGEGEELHGHAWHICGCVFTRPIPSNNVIRRNIARRILCLIIMTIIMHIIYYIYIYSWTRFVCIALLPVATIRREAKTRSDFSRTLYACSLDAVTATSHTTTSRSTRAATIVI